MRLNLTCLVFWKDMKTSLFLPPMTLDYLFPEEDNTKNKGNTGMFCADFHFA